ncbi:MAG: glycosyl hydrolase, partial [Candidatus Eremiobacteraeota bacterium]|nr:glycosyl hydrolase [Candidatus Eremiobacteraeota bacterium]
MAPLTAPADQRPIAQMRWRILGPALPEGRATAVVGSNAHPLLYYAGTAGGGVWKTTDGGASWQNISDSIAAASIGAVALDPNDDRSVWVGAGETNPRNDVIPESGLFHSPNGGRTWQKLDFSGEGGISRIVVDPKNPKHVVVGVLGNPFAASEHRGVYVSFDGGVSFAKTLYLSSQSGASDLAMDTHDPNVIFAGMWHVLRRPWHLSSGGSEDDGLFRSSD